MSGRIQGVLALLLLVSGCSSYDPNELNEEKELTALEDEWGGKAAGKSILLVPVQAPVPSEDVERAGPMRFEGEAFKQELLDALRRVMGPKAQGSRLKLAASSERKAYMDEAWQNDFDLIVLIEIKRWDAVFVETNGWWWPNALFVAWYFWPVGSWWIADEVYGVDVEVELTLLDVVSEEALPGYPKTIRVRSSDEPREPTKEEVTAPPRLTLDDLDRGIDLFGTWIQGDLDEDQWEQVGGMLEPYARRHTAVRLAAGVARGVGELETLDMKQLATTHALVVGISDYPADRCPAAAEDADRFRDLLTDEQARWAPNKNVVRLRNKNATATSVERALKRIGARCREHDRVVVYFAGRGKRNGAEGLDGLALRTYPEGSRESITLDALAKLLKDDVKARQRVIVIDAGFQDGPRGSTGGTGGPADRAQLIDTLHRAFLAEVDGGGVILATGLERRHRAQTYTTGQGAAQGLLTRYLLRGLKGEADQGGDGLTYADLAAYLDRHVHNLSEVALPHPQQPLVVGKSAAEPVVR